MLRVLMETLRPVTTRAIHPVARDPLNVMELDKPFDWMAETGHRIDHGTKPDRRHHIVLSLEISQQLGAGSINTITHINVRRPDVAASHMNQAKELANHLGPQSSSG